MTLERAVARNTTIQIVGKAASTALGLLAVAIMTRSLGAERFGWYVTATGWLQFIGIISDFGFTVTTSNLLAEPAFDKKRLLSTIFTWRLITATIFQGLAPLIILLFPYPREIKLAVAILTSSFFALAISQVFIGYYRTALRLSVVTTSEILGRIILVIGIALLALGQRGFLPMMAVVTIASLASSLYLALKYGRMRLSLDGAISRALMIRMWPTALAVICNALYLQADRVILPMFVNQIEVGLYGAAYRVLDIVIQLAAIIMGITMPLITFAWSRRLAEEFKQRYQLSFDLLNLLLIPILAGTLALATPLMRFVAGPEFTAAGGVLRWLAWSILGTCFGMAFGHVALAIGRQKEALWIYASDAIVSLIAYGIFIPRYGIFGAAGVTIFSELYAGAGLFFLTTRYSGYRPRLQVFFKTLFASALMAGILYYFQPLPLPLSLLLGAASYLAFIVLFGTIPLQTLREIISLPATAVVEETKV